MVFLAWRCMRNWNNISGRLSHLSKSWHPAVYHVQTVTPQNTDRCYSCLSSNRKHLQLQKNANGPLQLYENRRNIQYNLFYLLIEILEGQFMYIKNVTDLDWWLIIVLCTVPYRVALACFLRKKYVEGQCKANYINEELLPKYKKQEMKILSSPENMYISKQEKMKMFSAKMKEHQKRIYKEQNYSPWTMLVYTLTPLPFWIANSVALRNLCGAKVMFLPDATSSIVSPEMHTGGMLWFTDLTIPDPYHILPVVTCLSFFTMIELQALLNRKYGEKSKFVGLSISIHRSQKAVEYFIRLWCVFVVYLFWNCPAAMTWYWCCSGIIALIVRLLLIHPYVDRKLTPDNLHQFHDPHPYQTIWKNMQRRYNPRNWFL